MANDKNKQEKLLNQTEIGQKVAVERHEIQNGLASSLNERLRDIGEAGNPIAKTLEYKGSMACHIYESPVLGQVFFITQTQTMQDVSEITAGNALANLRGDMMAHYGRNRQKKRSGF